MESLANTLTRLGFSIPSPEAIARMDAEKRTWEAQERQRLIAERTKTAMIPAKYRYATVSTCPEGVREWASDAANGSTKSLILAGVPGAGKTFAACAALRVYLRWSDRGLYTDTKGMLNEIKSVFDLPGETVSSATSRFTAVPLLVVDDLGSVKPTDWAMETLFHIIKRRHEQDRPTIYTTMYDSRTLANQIAGNDPMKATAIMSRFKEASVVRIEGGDRRAA